MSDSESEALAAFVQRVVQQLEKNGFPDRQVSFPIERMYDAAYAKGVNFNKVLEALAERGIEHEKTPEKVIFTQPAFTALGLEPGALPGVGPSALDGLSPDERLAAASEAMKHMDPAQLAAIRAMVERMTPEQQAAMIEQARKLGLA
jgi:hypothetical protein